jgi:polysaccharide biosynthesis/export protein
MALGRFFRFAFLMVSLVLTIDRQTAAQNAPTLAPPAAQNTEPAIHDNAGAQAAVQAGAQAGVPAGVFATATGKESAAPPESGAPLKQEASASTSTSASTSAPQLRIGGGDLININVYGIPEMAQDVRVNNGGDIYLPLIGYVQVGGLTPDQAQTVIENRLREGGFVNNPHVTVSLKDYVNQSATVTGEVTKPGVYPILGTQRLLEVLATAGGLTPRAGKTLTITHRDQPDEPVTAKLPSDLAKSPKDNIEIFPGDTVVVNRAGVVYVVGEVTRPSGLIMDNNEKMTVIQAIALVGGTTSVAAMNSAKLIRPSPNGRKEVPLALAKMLSGKQTDVGLEPDDIIFVPASFGKKAARRTAESALTVTQSLAIYRP